MGSLCPLFLVFLASSFTFGTAFLTSEPEQAVLLSSNEVSETEDQTLFNFVMMRTAAHTQNVLYSEDEFDMYQLPREDLFNKITVLGKAQAWSFGNHLRVSYPSLYKNLNSESVKAMYINLEKSQVTVEHFLMGLYGKTPNWLETDFADSTVWENVQANGKCYGCPDSSIINLEKLFKGELNQDEESIDVPLGEENLDQLTVHSVNACPRLLSNYHIPAVLGAVNDNFFHNIHFDQIADYYNYIGTLYTEEEKSMIINVRLLTFLVWEAHNLHMLPEISTIPEFLRKILTIENAASSERHHFLNILYLQDEYVRVTSTKMLENIKNALIEATENPSELKTILYAVHDNNMASFLISLIGRDALESDWISYRPAYSSSIQMLLKSDSMGNYYVNILVNQQLRTIEGCDVNCPLEQLTQKINSQIIPDFIAYCKDYPNVSE